MVPSRDDGQVRLPSPQVARNNDDLRSAHGTFHDAKRNGRTGALLETVCPESTGEKTWPVIVFAPIFPP